MNNFIIYKHTNLLNNKSYIGITIHNEYPNARWEGGFGYKNQPKFYQAIQEFGWNNFSHEIIENDVSPFDVERKEREYIALYDSYKNGYNASPGGNIPSDEGRKKISNALTGIKRSSESITKQITTKIKNSGWSNGIDPIDTNLSQRVRCKETGDIFGSITEAENWSNSCKISECCKGLRQHAGRHPNTNELLSWEFVSKDTPISIRCIEKRKTNKIKKIRCIETNEIFQSAIDAFKKTGIANCNITRVCKGQRKTAGGFHWEFIEE